MSFPRFAVLVILCVATFACASATAADADRAALLKTDQQWAAVASAGRDIDAIVSYWADDATVYPENAPVIHGKAAIRQYVAESLKIPGFHITWKPLSAVVSRGGDLGYTTDENAISLQVANGTIATFPGRGVTVWRKQEGQWKCVEDIWNSGKPPGQ